MANRLFLTLLALLTGLAAQVAPVQARVTGRPAEVGAVANAEVAQRHAAAAVVLMARMRTEEREAREVPLSADPAKAWTVPAVRIGADRARE